MLSFWSRRVLFCEGVLNTVSALLMIFAPAFVLTQLGMTSGVDGAHLSITQQLGSIILILGYIGLRCVPESIVRVRLRLLESNRLLSGHQ